MAHELSESEQVTVLVVLISILAVLGILALAFGWTCLLAALVVWVLGGFGLNVLFWPTLGGLMLIQVLLGWLASALRPRR